MHLFLTSSPCDDHVPQGCDLPCILFEKNQFVSRLRSLIAPGGVCAIVAADPHNHRLNDEMAVTFHRAFAWHGMTFRSTELVDDRSVENLPALLEVSSLVILAGGHVPTEHAFFEQIGLRERLQGYDGVVMGISAGSMNCCTEVYAQPEEPGEATDPGYVRFFPGLGLTDIMVLPHFQRVRNNWLDGMRLIDDITLGDSVGRVFYALPDSSYVLVEDGHATLYGEAWQIQDGAMRQIASEGDVLRLV